MEGNNNKVGCKLAYIAGNAPQKSSLKDTNGLSESVGSSFRDKIIKQEKARKCEKILDGGVWMLASIVATITSLLAYDFTIAFLPQEVDISTDIILLIVFWGFFIELIVASLVRGYFLSFWFWLDFIAMIPDLTLLLAVFGATDGDINVANTQASKSGKSGRSAVPLKAIRMIRFSVLLRVLRVFKFFQTAEYDDAEQNVADAESSKVGQIVSETVTKKVIVLVLVLVLVLPWMDPSGASYGEAAETSAYLFKNCIDNGVNTQESLNIFENVGNELLNDKNTISNRRPIEMWTSQMDNIYKCFLVHLEYLFKSLNIHCLDKHAMRKR